MVKKVLTLAFGLMLFIGAMAQTPKTAAIAASDVRYWVGSGSNQAVVLITWEELDGDGDEYYIGAVWGVRFNGTILCNSLMDTISTYDANLSISMNSGRSFINDMTYANIETGLELNGSGMGWWMYTVNGDMASAINSQSISDGDFVEWSDMGQFAADTIIFLEDPNAPDQPVEATIAASDILYWVGEGSNEVVMAVNWADTALAWGYKFNGTKTVSDMMTDIAAADPRFSYTTDGAYLNDILFVVAPGDTLRKQAYSYWESKNNGISDAGMAQTLNNGDFEKWGEPAAGVVVDSFSYEWGGETYWSYIYVYPMAINPVSVPAAPMPEESTIAASDILYWVGEGSNEVVMAVNWADTALAWGYKFNGTKTVSDMMTDIAAADPRFSYTMDGAYLNDILFVVAPGDTLRKQAYGYWESKNNGISDAGMAQTLNNGDFEKWAEPAAGVIVDSMEYNGYWYYSYVYPMEIHPVGVPQTQGIVNTENVSINVYPNPVADMVTISGIEGNGRAVLYDMRGSIVASFAVNGTETRLDLGRLTAGIYMLRVDDSVVKIIKE